MENNCNMTAREWSRQMLREREMKKPDRVAVFFQKLPPAKIVKK